MTGCLQWVCNRADGQARTLAQSQSSLGPGLRVQCDAAAFQIRCRGRLHTHGPGDKGVVVIEAWHRHNLACIKVQQPLYIIACRSGGSLAALRSCHADNEHGVLSISVHVK